jgi:hypothetical protein
MTEVLAPEQATPIRLFTTKQMGDACEMLIAAELTLAGIPALKVPDNWPGYDVIAQPKGGTEPLRISVKSRTFKKGGGTFLSYYRTDVFDWLAMVILQGGTELNRRFFLIPRKLADETARRDKPTSGSEKERYWRVDELARLFSAYENNFELQEKGVHVKPGTSR